MYQFIINPSGDTLSQVMCLSDERAEELYEAANSERKALMDQEKEKSIAEGVDSYGFNAITWLKNSFVHCKSENETVFMSNFIGFEIHKMKVQEQRSPIERMLGSLL